MASVSAAAVVVAAFCYCLELSSFSWPLSYTRTKGPKKGKKGRPTFSPFQLRSFIIMEIPFHLFFISVGPLALNSYAFIILRAPYKQTKKNTENAAAAAASFYYYMGKASDLMHGELAASYGFF